MENQKMQNAAEVRDKKKRLIEEATREISDIQFTGQAIRAQIDIAKEIALASIEETKSQNILNDTVSAAEQSELIRQIGDAAKSGNLAEVQRLKDLLDGSITQS